MASSSYTTPAAYSHATGSWAASARSARDTVKDDVMLQYGGVQVAHNVDASIEATVAHRWQAMGILPRGFYPAHPKKLMPLCIACHHAYNDPYPIWVALPEDLDRFIEFERNDYEARVWAAADGVSQPRSLPPVDILSL
ncbi:hypothetical protein EMCG_01782 [[Emmonsia] crescens]|uniref:Uncharacterized protein n=1 Tax=[Emmonsia] crescens TaxID=73230 RepID=A0A0G2I0P6_9EURO|nr:hypothetical protein EMCG_01782 [Emmonsia crescens UAMH 3008]